MKIIARYILRRFFNLLFFIILAGIIIFLSVDLIEHLDKFIDREAGWRSIGYYYLYYIPYVVYLIIPVAILLTTLFSLGSMTAANEVIALKSAGVSIYRILYVVALPALVMSFLTLGLGETLVPYFNKKRMAIYREKVEKIPKTSVTRRGRIYMVDGRDRIVHIGHYNAENLTGFNINIQTVKDNTLLSRLDASRMRYSKDHWVLFNAVKRDFAGDSVRMEKIYAYDWRELNFKPEDLLKIQSKPEEMNYWELREFIDKLISTGSDAIRWRVDLNNKLATPFAVLVIVIFGVPIAVVKRRSGLMVGFGISLLVCFLYFGVTKSIQILGYKSLLPPLLSAWSGNAIFLIVGLMAVVKVGK